MGNSGKLEDNTTVQWTAVVKTLLCFSESRPNTLFV